MTRAQRNAIGREPPRIALVLWTGGVGGAEVATLTLARFLRAEGAIVKPVFVGVPGVIGERFTQAGFPLLSLSATPGSRVLLAPRRAAAMVRSAGPDGAILVSGGILAAALRAGGYSSRLIAVEHGALAQVDAMGILRQLRTIANWSSGSRLVDLYVGVSRFIVEVVRRHAPGCRVMHVPNGIDTAEFSPRGQRPANSRQRNLVIGCAGRLIRGKGFEDAIDATARAASRVPIVLRLAGDGPLRAALTLRAETPNSGLTVQFMGWSDSMPDFWNKCDIAVVPTSGLVEAFGMTALEAMACGVPVIVSDSGGLPEVVVDGRYGSIYPAGNVAALSSALIRLATDPTRRRLMSEEARAHVLRRFDAPLIARAYLDLFEDMDPHATR